MYRSEKLWYYGNTMVKSTELTQMDDILERASTLSRQSHDGQMYGTSPYFDGHVLSVAELVAGYTDDRDIIAAAYLHDVLEDTTTAFEDIRSQFGWNVAYYVDAVTDPPGDTRRERKERLIEKFKMIDSEHVYGASLVKCCDRFANHRECLTANSVSKMSMYSKEFPSFMSVFGVGLITGHASTERSDLWMKLFEQYALLLKRVNAYS